MNVTDATPFKVGDWLVEPGLLRISKNGEIRKLEFRTMEILLFLVAQQGKVVSKNRLHEEVWREVYVTDNALTRAVSKLRKVFDDDPLNPSYIDTISKSGYRLVARVEYSTPQTLNGNKTILATPATRTMRPARLWFWGIAVIIIAVGGIRVAITSSTDTYSAFHNPVPVSTLIGPELGHAISPDGKKISISYSEPGANNADVYVRQLDDLSLTKVTDQDSNQGYGIWSPDGSYMAYASDEGEACGIYKLSGFGGERTRIGECFRHPEDFVWSPDGKVIAFSDYAPGKQTRSIFFLDIDTRVAKEVMIPAAGLSDRDPAFSPDGEYLYFRRGISNRGSDIYKMRLADQELTKLTYDNARILGLDVFDNGRQIAFASDRGGIWGLWKVSVNGGEVTRINVNDRVPIEPKFSTDGKRMVYKSSQDQTRIWAFDRQGGGDPVPVAGSTRAEAQPAFSHDEEKMVFISSRSGYFEIWSIIIEDNHTTKLTALEGSFINSPSLSPDKAEVLFDARINGGNAIYIVDVASKTKRQFIDLDGDQLNARYSRDGKTIYFASNHSGSWQIWKKSVFDDPAGIQQLTVNGGYYVQEGFDNHVYYTRADTSGIWRIGSEAKEELFIASLQDFDWGNWVPVADGIIYLDRSEGQQVHFQPYDSAKPYEVLLNPTKPIQTWSPSLTATSNGNKIFIVQIENSEDEIMMVEF